MSRNNGQPKVRFTKNGNIDRRCAAVRSGNLRLTNSGDIDGRSSAIRSGDVIVNSSGGIDKRSRMLRNSDADSFDSPSLRFNLNGQVDRRSSAVRSELVIVKKDGSVDGRSKAIKRNQLRLKKNGDINLNSSIEMEYETEYPEQVRDIVRDIENREGKASNIKEEKLRESYAKYLAVKKVDTRLLRNGSAQAKFRRQSRSRFKDEKQAAHKVSLELIAKLLDQKKGPKLSYDTFKKLRETLNPPEGFRLVLEHTNNPIHRQLDASLLAKVESKEPLNELELRRATIAAQTFFNHMSDDVPVGLTNKFAEFFDSLRTSDGSSVLDSVELYEYAISRFAGRSQAEMDVYNVPEWFERTYNAKILPFFAEIDSEYSSDTITMANQGNTVQETQCSRYICPGMQWSGHPLRSGLVTQCPYCWEYRCDLCIEAHIEQHILQAQYEELAIIMNAFNF